LRNAVEKGRRVCSRCKKAKPNAQFHRDKQRRYQRYCKPCRREVGQLRDNRKYRLKSDYGLTLEEFQTLLEKQNGCCTICEQPFPEQDPKREDGYRRIRVDHDHTTGAVRGLLCHSCNTGLGFYEKVIRPKQKEIDKYLSRILRVVA
jgi:hypothetical protein